MKKFNITILLTVALILFSFTVVQAQKSYSVEICNVDKKAIIDYLVNSAAQNGFTLINVNDYQVTMKKDDERFLSKLYYGSHFNRTPEVRFYFTIAQTGNNVRLAVESRMVTNPGSGFEKSEVIDNDDTQKMLDNFKANVERSTVTDKPQEQGINPLNIVGFNVDKNIINNKCLVVNNIDINGNAYRSGLRKGDFIKEINDLSVSNMNSFDLSTFLKWQREREIKLLIISADTNEEKTLVFDKQ